MNIVAEQRRVYDSRPGTGKLIRLRCQSRRPLTRDWIRYLARYEVVAVRTSDGKVRKVDDLLRQ